MSTITRNIRSAYIGRQSVSKSFKKPTRTKQSFKNECDINKIMLRYQKTGVLEHVNKHQGQYVDVSDMGDYQQALHQLAEAQESFMSLPAAIRKEFGNDPGAFLEFMADEANIPRMIELGLATADQKASNRSVSGSGAEPQDGSSEPDNDDVEDAADG